MNGFFYVGEEDIVKCFCCNIKLQKWLLGDRAISEHAKWSETCPMVAGKACVKWEGGEDMCQRYSEVYRKSIQTQIPDEQKCKVCITRKINTVFIPCGHLAACQPYAETLDNCAICRQEIKDRQAVFFT